LQKLNDIVVTHIADVLFSSACALWAMNSKPIM